jgi:hypothetical protein
MLIVIFTKTTSLLSPKPVTYSQYLFLQDRLWYYPNKSAETSLEVLIKITHLSHLPHKAIPVDGRGGL